MLYLKVGCSFVVDYWLKLFESSCVRINFNWCIPLFGIGQKNNYVSTALLMWLTRLYGWVLIMPLSDLEHTSVSLKDTMSPVCQLLSLAKHSYMTEKHQHLACLCLIYNFSVLLRDKFIITRIFIVKWVDGHLRL